MADKRFLLQFNAATGFKVVLEFGGEYSLNENIEILNFSPIKTGIKIII